MWKFFKDYFNGLRTFEVRITKKVYIYGMRKLNTKTYIYIGQTLQEPEARIYAHLSDAYNNRHKNKELQKIIRKHRFFITFDILEVCSEKDSGEREKWWIDKLKSERHRLVNIRNPENPFSNLKS